MNFWKWASGFFSDPNGQASRKAGAGWWTLGLVTVMIWRSLAGVAIDFDIFMTLVTFCGAMFGLTIFEKFAPNKWKTDT